MIFRKKLLPIFSFLLFFVAISSSTAAETWFDWSELPGLPEKTTGAYYGVLDGKPVVAGGSNIIVSESGGEERGFSDRIFVLDRDASAGYRWLEAGSLPRPMAFGASVACTDAFGPVLLCLGGENEEEISGRIVLLRFEPGTQKLVAEEFAGLPEPRSRFAAAVLRDRLYTAGGKGEKTVSEFRSILLADLVQKRSGWQTEPAWPGDGRCDASLVRQNRGDRDVLYLIGGRYENENKKLSDECLMFDPLRDGAEKWTVRKNTPFGTASAAAIPRGQSHILLFGGDDGEGGEEETYFRDVLAYHTITDTWCVGGRLPGEGHCIGAMPLERGVVLPCNEKTVKADFKPARTNFAWWDYVALFGYFGFLACLGYYLASWKKTSGDFLVGKRRIPWWAAALSLMATQVSSIGAMSIPAKSYATNWSYFVIVGVWFLVVPIVTRFYIPFFRGLNLTSAYEYLEFRFHWTVRLLAMFIYSLSQLGRMAIVLYLPALALTAVTGIDPKLCILIMGVICTFYTFMGGLEAVIWIDCFQAIVLIGGILLCVCVIVFGLDGGVVSFASIAWNDAKFSLGTLKFDLTSACLWVLLVGNFFTRFGNLTADQAVIQRYLTTKSSEAARRSLWGDVVLSIPWALLVFSFGTALYVFFKTNPLLLNPVLDTDGIVPYYIAVELTAPGLAGVIIAAIFAAAMSSFDSSIHSVATIWVVDVYARFVPSSSDRSRLRLARCFIFLLGVFGTAAALWLTMFDIRSLWDQFFAITGLFIGGLTGLFALGMFTRRTESVGAILGIFVSAAVLWGVIHYTKIHFFLYPAIGCTVCFAVGCLVGLVRKARPEAAEFTIFRSGGSMEANISRLEEDGRV